MGTMPWRTQDDNNKGFKRRFFCFERTQQWQKKTQHLNVNPLLSLKLYACTLQKRFHAFLSFIS